MRGCNNKVLSGGRAGIEPPLDEPEWVHIGSRMSRSPSAPGRRPPFSMAKRGLVTFCNSN